VAPLGAGVAEPGARSGDAYVAVIMCVRGAHGTVGLWQGGGRQATSSKAEQRPKIEPCVDLTPSKRHGSLSHDGKQTDACAAGCVHMIEHWCGSHVRCGALAAGHRDSAIPEEGSTGRFMAACTWRPPPPCHSRVASFGAQRRVLPSGAALALWRQSCRASPQWRARNRHRRPNLAQVV